MSETTLISRDVKAGDWVTVRAEVLAVEWGAGFEQRRICVHQHHAFSAIVNIERPLPHIEIKDRVQPNWQESGWSVPRKRGTGPTLVTAYTLQLPGGLHAVVEKRANGKWILLYPECSDTEFPDAESAKEESARVLLALATRSIELLRGQTHA